MIRFISYTEAFKNLNWIELTVVAIYVEQYFLELIAFLFF